MDEASIFAEKFLKPYRQILNRLVLLSRFRQNLGGVNPWFNPLHFQYLGVREHNSWLKQTLCILEGTVIDYGCGNSPYKKLVRATRYIGVDIPECSAADVFVEDGWRIPLPDKSCDGLLSTQAIEHVELLDEVVEEWQRVLKQGSPVVVTMPFMFHLHGAPHDYRRFTEFGMASFFARRGFEIVEQAKFGGIGTYLVVGIQDAIECQTGRIAILLRLVLQPVLIAITPLLNLIGFCFDKLDKSGVFYSSVALRMVLR